MGNEELIFGRTMEEVDEAIELAGVPEDHNEPLNPERDEHYCFVKGLDAVSTNDSWKEVFGEEI